MVKMEKKNGSLLWGAGSCAALFLVLTVLVLTVDVRPVGPEGSAIGLAALNGGVFALLGESGLWYEITELLGYIALGTMAFFAGMGALQLISRKSLRRVDRDILLLGLCYGVMLGLYILFELVVINCRPVLVEGVLEASFPSSHTMLVVTVLGSAAVWAGRHCGGGLRKVVQGICLSIALLTAVGRLLSGMHWFTDILAGLLLAGALVMGYAGFANHEG